MSEEGLGQNLIDVDILLHSLGIGQPKIILVRPIQRIEEDRGFDHDEIVEKPVEIGNSLGLNQKRYLFHREPELTQCGEQTLVG